MDKKHVRMISPHRTHIQGLKDLACAGHEQRRQSVCGTGHQLLCHLCLLVPVDTGNDHATNKTIHRSICMSSHENLFRFYLKTCKSTQQCKVILHLMSGYQWSIRTTNSIGIPSTARAMSHLLSGCQWSVHTTNSLYSRGR